MTELYDLAVIGGGPGGFSAAMRAAQLGAQVALVEERKLGGNCMHRACIPAQTLIAVAKLAAAVRQAGQLGLQAGEPTLDMEALHTRKERIIAGLQMGTQELLSDRGVSLFQGRGTLADRGIVQVGEQQFRARNTLIATGSVAAQLPIEGADLPGVVGPDQVIALRQVPSRVAVLVHTPLDLQLAQYLHLLGSQVTLLTGASRLLPEADREIGQRFGKQLYDAGIAIQRGVTLEAIRRQDDGSLSLVLAGDRDPVLAEQVVATRRLPNTAGLGLRDLGVRLKGGAIVTDERMQSNIPHLYAVGDATTAASGPATAQWSHKASAEGIVAAENAMGLKSQMRYDTLPRCLYTLPEVAWVGLSEEQATAQGLEVAVGRAPMAINPQAILLGQTTGVIKVIADRKYGKIHGVHMMAPGATDLINAATIAMLAEATVRELIDFVPAHPSIGEALVDAAMDVEKRSLHLPRQ